VALLFQRAKFHRWERVALSIFSAIFQGIVQGLTEFLPVSSSGHLSLIQYFSGQSGETGIFFSILLHLGTLLAVFLAFYKTILEIIAAFFAILGDIFRGRFSLRKASPQQRMVLLLIVSLLPMIITVIFRDWFSALASDDSILAEGICFLLTSVLLFLSVKCVKGHKNAATMQYKDAVAVGLVQSVAPLPGLSRSGSTISVGLMMGLDRKFAVAFSFIMGVPAVLGANVLEIGDAVRQGIELPWSVMLTGLAFSFVFGLLAIKMVNWLVTSDKFKYFAWYTLILGGVTVLVAIVEKLSDHAVRQWVMGLFS